MSGAFTFDHDTTLTPGDGGVFAATVSDHYNIGPVPNGGYVMSLALRAVAERMPGREPLSLTTHFLRPAVAGPARIEVETVKEAKRYATARARLFQSDQEVATSLATFRLPPEPGAHAAMRHVRGAPPELVPVEEAVAIPRSDFFKIGQQFDMRLDPRVAGVLQGRTNGEAEVVGYARFEDGREPDLASLPLFADAAMPAVFGVLSPNHVPTIEMTVHFRAHPVPGYLRFVFRTRFAFEGVLEEDGELWDSAGNLVAQSRQLAQMPRP